MHLRTHQEETKQVEPMFSCNQCPRKYSTKDRLRAHMLSHTKVACDLCGKPYSYMALVAHKSNEIYLFFNDKRIRND